MIDIVITYLNERDKQWQTSFNYWKDKEIQEGKASISNRQAFGKERTREWDTLKYWFRGIENNCKWVNKVFLIVQNKNHVPKWLDTNNPKLRIVYHNEYIPEQLLPTFNAMTIGMYVSNIKDLSENYIMCDDDFYFLNPIEEDRFFKDNKPIHPNNRIKYSFYGDLTSSDNVFYKILNNNLIFETDITRLQIKYGFYHLPDARKKNFEKKILTTYKNRIDKANSYSRFRNEHNLCPYMFNDLLKLCNEAELGNPYTNCSYCNLNSNVNFNDYWDKDIVCFNDTERLDNYELTKKKLIDFLERKFPNKSSFEKE